MTKPFDTIIGVVGGGQLGKMLIESSAGWNLKYNILEAEESAPAVRHASGYIKGVLTDSDKIRELAAKSDIITYEIEHIDAHTLYELEQKGMPVIPSASVLQIIQDKGVQKQYFKRKGLPTSPFVILNHPGEMDKLRELGPQEKLVVKSCREGYDGKGVAVIKADKILDEAGKLPFEGAVVVEKFIYNAREFSVQVARNRNGEVKTYPVVEMVFDPISNLVDYLFAPANIQEESAKIARDLAIKAIEGFQGVGIFAVELFMNYSGEWFVNEIAPRPHNSGHHTIEACYTSQYEQLNRILLDLPLGDTSLIQPAAMVNLVGPYGLQGTYKLEGLEVCFRTPGFYLHLYDKKTIKPDRKMGHFTVLARTVDDAIDQAMMLKKHLRFVSDQEERSTD